MAAVRVGIEYQVFEAHRLVVFAHVGPVPDAVLTGWYAERFRDPAFPRSYDRIVDLRRAESAVRSPAALRAIDELVRETHHDVARPPRTAIVAPRDVSFGLGRMFSAYAGEEPGPIRVFRAIPAALDWLRLPADVVS